MKVKECLNNLFETMDGLQENQEIFNFVDSKLLDKYYANMYGNREVTEIVENLEIIELATILKNQFMNKWNNIILNYLDSENILENYKEITTEINKDTLNNVNTRTNTNKVSAYNDEDFVNKDEDTTVDETDIINNRDKNIVRTKIKDTDFYDKVNKYLTNFNIYNIMVIDINSIVTLNILN